MGTTLIRLFATFAFWSVAFAGLVLAGVSGRLGEVVCATGAGLTLLGWGVGLHFKRTSIDSSALPSVTSEERRAGS